jgi:hypothetical protein
MKKILTAIILAAGITSGFAQWQPNQRQTGGPQQGNSQQYPQQNNNYNQYSSLIVSSVSQRQFLVYVDNQQYQGNGNNGNGSTINIGQLQAGNHTVAVYENRRNFWGKTVQDKIYNSSLYLKPGFETTVFINALGQVNISERQLYNNSNNGGYDNGGYGNNGNGNGYGYGRRKDKHKQKCGNDDRRDYSRNDNRRGNNNRDDD